MSTDRIYLSGRFMLMGLLGVLFCSFVIAGQMSAQEVIVARETKPEAPKQVAPASEQTPSESATPAPTKARPRQKKAGSALPTLEQMRMAGARAAEGSNNRSLQQSTRAGETDLESALAPSASVAETPKPVKRKIPVEERSTSPVSRPRSTNMEWVGAVRPTMIESGRQEPSATPSPKWQGQGEQGPAP